jgi:hypothetical protein
MSEAHTARDGTRIGSLLDGYNRIDGTSLSDRLKRTQYHLITVMFMMFIVDRRIVISSINKESH